MNWTKVVCSTILLEVAIYTVLTWQEEGVWSAMSPSVPGVFGLGSTRVAAENDFTEALSTLADYLDEIGEPLPPAQRIYVRDLSV